MVMDEIASRLVSLGVGALIGANKNIFQGAKATIPTGNGPFLLMVAYGGSGADRTNSSVVSRPSVQIESRAGDYKTAETMLKAAFNALGGDMGLHNITINGIFYLSITPRQEFIDMGVDDAVRARIAFNIDIQKEPS